MALNKALEDLLAQVTDEAERNTMRQSFEKHTFLQGRFEGNLRQEDYDRQMNKAKTDREAEAALVKQYETEKTKWVDWANKNVPKFHEMEKSYDTLKAEKDALEAEKAELVLRVASGAGDGATVDPKDLMDKVNAEILKRGFVSSKDTERIAVEQAQKLLQQERDAFYSKAVPGLLAEAAGMNELQFRHRDEFGGKPLNQGEFAKFRAEKKIADMGEAYDRFTAAAREEVKFEKVRKEAYEAAEKKFASERNLPGSGAPPTPSEYGPLQRLSMEGKLDVDPNVSGAAAAANSLRSEGKF